VARASTAAFAPDPFLLTSAMLTAAANAANAANAAAAAVPEPQWVEALVEAP
jgi:hypothetical protein